MIFSGLRNFDARSCAVDAGASSGTKQRRRAAALHMGFSELVNEAVQLALREDALDEEAYRRREKEPSRAFATVLRELKSARLI